LPAGQVESAAPDPMVEAIMFKPAFRLCVLATLLLSASAPCQTKFTPAPGDETAEAKKRIDEAEATLRAGKSTTEILTDPSFLPAHEWPRFRKLIRQSALSSRATLVTPTEPGMRMVVVGRVVDRAGQPMRGALIYVYHTSAKGWYSDRAAHFAAHEGDRRHARLFGYMRTDADGRYELHTIRPAGYPDADLPAHIHVEIEPPDSPSSALVTEIQFDDDPRLTPEWRRRSRQEGFQIAKVHEDAGGAQRVEVEFRTRSLSSPAQGPLDWSLGEWVGVRKDGEAKTEFKITVRVEPILGSAGQAEHLEVRHPDGVYRGFTVRVPAKEGGRWVMLYMNSNHGGFAQLDGEVQVQRSTWHSGAPDKPRRSRLLSEPTASGGWRRTMSVSDDKGNTWRVLWIDELRRDASATPKG
jgi:protocatechuate 3,4-dioxygenase beta subunit